VQSDIGKMVAKHSVAPQAMFDPESAVEQRIVLLRGAQVEPDAPQPVQGLHGRRRDVGGVIPNQAAMERGPVCQGNREENRRPGGKDVNVNEPGEWPERGLIGAWTRTIALNFSALWHSCRVPHIFAHFAKVWELSPSHRKTITSYPASQSMPLPHDQRTHPLLWHPPTLSSLAVAMMEQYAAPTEKTRMSGAQGKIREFCDRD